MSQRYHSAAMWSTGTANMNPPTDPPPELIPVTLAKGCLLLLNKEEYLMGMKRGKLWRRTQAASTREDIHTREVPPTR